MLNIRSIILGSTPIRTTSPTVASRRRLFQTPTTTSSRSNFQPDVSADTVTIDVNAGTMVVHVEDLSSNRSNLTGVVLRTTAGPSPTTLDILWNKDGQITPVTPTCLRLLQPTQIVNAAATTATEQTPTTASTTTYQRNNTRQSFKPLLPAKLPKELRQNCPLDSINMPEIENFQIRIDNFLSQGHPRIR